MLEEKEAMSSMEGEVICVALRGANPMRQSVVPRLLRDLQ
jgi:hypothetical protein